VFVDGNDERGAGWEEVRGLAIPAVTPVVVLPRPFRIEAMAESGRNLSLMLPLPKVMAFPLSDGGENKLER
jgi:hypothetical protein